jgi:hypothetical protein
VEVTLPVLLLLMLVVTATMNAPLRFCSCVSLLSLTNTLGNILDASPTKPPPCQLTIEERKGRQKKALGTPFPKKKKHRQLWRNLNECRSRQFLT